MITQEQLAEWKRTAEDARWRSAVEHRPGCPAIADDESDYEHLTDAGVCVCGATFMNAAREAVPALIAEVETLRALLRTVVQTRGRTRCVFCERVPDNDDALRGHSPDCRLAAALRTP